MNNQNSSKQVLLSIIGIAILVVAVVGVSFAFFNYSKVGTDNNQVTTGTIFFNFTEGDAISLKNQFPMDDATGKALTSSVGTEGANGNGVLTFSAIGHNTAKSDITYDIYVLAGDKTSVGDAFTEKLSDADIKLYLVDKSERSTMTDNVAATPITVQKALAQRTEKTTGALTAALGNTKDSGLKLASDTIKGGSDSNTKKNYELRMWISDDVQIVGEKAQIQSTAKKGPSNFEAGVYDEDSFGKMYYSIKLYMEATTPSVKQP